VLRCPVCDAARVIIVVGSTRRGLCAACGARWIQDGDVQRRVQRPIPQPSSSGQGTGAR
jgi:Zn-finger nucleic acid-binding protein